MATRTAKQPRSTALRDRERLFTLLDALEAGDGKGTRVTSLRYPQELHDAMSVAIRLGMGPSVSEASVDALVDRLEAFAQSLALEAEFSAHPHLRPDLGELAVAAAELDGNPLAGQPKLLLRAAAEVVEVKPDADADDVLVYAAALARQRA